MRFGLWWVVCMCCLHVCLLLLFFFHLCFGPLSEGQLCGLLVHKLLCFFLCLLRPHRCQPGFHPARFQQPRCFPTLFGDNLPHLIHHELIPFRHGNLQPLFLPSLPMWGPMVHSGGPLSGLPLCSCCEALHLELACSCLLALPLALHPLFVLDLDVLVEDPLPGLCPLVSPHSYLCYP